MSDKLTDIRVRAAIHFPPLSRTIRNHKSKIPNTPRGGDRL